MSHYSNEHSVVINFQHMNKYVWSNIIRRHNQKLELGAKGVRKRGKLPSGIRGKARRETLFGYVNAADSVRRTCCVSMNCLKRPTLRSLWKSSLTVHMFCINFCRLLRRHHITIVCVIELISSVYRTVQDALWTVTFSPGPCIRTFI